MNDLADHYENHHPAPDSVTEDSVKCSLCSFAGDNVEDLERHIISVHAHKCKHCDEILSSQRSLDIHVQSKHKEDDVNGLDTRCSYCGESGLNNNDLRAHIQVHHKILRVDASNVAPSIISCEFCDYRCNLNIKL